MEGGNSLPVGFYSVVAVAFLAIIEDGIEEHEGIGLRAHEKVFAFFKNALGGAGGCCDMTSGGAPSGCDHFRIDAQFLGVGPDPADGGVAVLDAFERSCSITGFYAILGADGHHSEGSKVGALWVEL